MAIFNKSNQQADYSSNITTIAAGSNITGKIDVECELHIDGEVDADIKSTGLIKIGQSGVVTSNSLRANRLVVSGKFSGEADCEAIEIINGGDVHGKLTATSLEIDASGLFQGESVRKQPGEHPIITDVAKAAEDNNSEYQLFGKSAGKSSSKSDSKSASKL